MVPKTTKREPAATRRTASTLDGRESQIVSDAYDLAERQIRDGTASAQVVSHFLKLGSTRERLEQQRLTRENELLSAKVEQLQSQKRVEELYENAINAMGVYSGREDSDYDE